MPAAHAAAVIHATAAVYTARMIGPLHPAYVVAVGTIRQRPQPALFLVGHVGRSAGRFDQARHVSSVIASQKRATDVTSVGEKPPSGL